VAREGRGVNRNGITVDLGAGGSAYSSYHGPDGDQQSADDHDGDEHGEGIILEHGLLSIPGD
jgi:hypothetical protein